MPAPLCQNCELRKANVGAAQLEAIRARTSDPDDVDRILDLPNGEQILGALALLRPARCRLLEELVGMPPPDDKLARKYGDITLAHCPEVALAGLISHETELDF